MLIFDEVARQAAQRADALAVVEVGADGARREWSWRQLDVESRRWAAALLELGVKPGEPVAYQLPNMLEFVAISLGALRIGAVCEPLMPIFRERELEFMLRESGARVLIVPSAWRGHDHAAMAHALARQLPSLEHVVVLDDSSSALVVEPAGQVGSKNDTHRLVSRPSLRPEAGGAAPAGAAETSPSGSTDAAEGENARHAVVSAPILPEMTAQLLFTSGSTGEPKGVLQTHAALNAAVAIHHRHFGLTQDDVIYAPSPLAHQTGFLYGMWTAIMAGATQVIQCQWSGEVGLEAMCATGVSFVQAATPFLADLVRASSEQGRTPQALRIFVATGAAIPRELARQARDVLEAEVGGAFGTTESCLGAAFIPGADPDHAWSADGHVLEGVTLRIVDDDGCELPAGSEGNFEVLTETLFQGYLNRPELTAEALTADGYYRTGDLAVIDAEGYLHITGRVKDVINRGGEKVPVVEVEQVLYNHPAVRDVAIVAMPDPRLGERACAFVVLEDDASFEFIEMQAYLDAVRLAKPYWPERLEIVEELPLTPSGKIQKFVLRDRVSAQLQREAIPR